MLRSSNPAMKPFEQPMTWDQLGSIAREPSTTMTVSGTVSKTMLNLAFAGVGGLVVWSLFTRGLLPVGAGFIGVLVFAAVSWIGTMVINAKPHTAKVLGPILSCGSGAWAAFVSFAVASMVQAKIMANGSLVGLTQPTEAQAFAAASGLIFQAFLLTAGVVGAIALATGMGILRIGGTAAKVITGVTGAIMFVYIAGWALRLLGFGGIPGIHGAGIVGIGFSLFVVVIASLNVAMAFSSVLSGVKNKLPRHFEWVAGHAIVATVIWLYVEILILLYKLFARRD